MGLFNRSNQPQRRQIRTMHKERPNENGDLQYKAKSKLIGAAVLAALGAVILPFIFSSEEPINQVTTNGQAPLVAPGAQGEAGTSGTIAISAAPGVSVQSTEQGATVATTEETAPTTEAETSVQGTIDTTDLNNSTEIPQSIASAVGESPVETPVAVATQPPKSVTTPVKNPSKASTSKPEPSKQVTQKPTTQVPATTIVPTPNQSVASSTQVKPVVEVAKPTKPTGELKPVAPRQEVVLSTSEPIAKPQATVPKVEDEPKRTVATPQKEEPKRAAASKPEVKSEPKADAKATAKTETKTESKANAKVDNVKRTDDGSAARALLEGKKVASTSSATKGSANSNFPKLQSSASTAKQRLTVQVGSFTSMDDARAQRDRLSSSGVSNVFVQNAVVNGRQTYRLRVGPFTNQESAQAALTRLRGLGHNGFITGN